MHDKLQSRRLRQNFKRLPFRSCGWCKAVGSLYVPYHPTRVGFWRWCYTCGAKDKATVSLPR